LVNDPFEKLNFINAPLESVSRTSVAMVTCIKAEPGQPRFAYRITFEGEPALLKLQRFDTIKSILRATRGESYLDREAAVTQAAQEAGLPVNRLRGRAWRRRLGFMVEQGLIWTWIDDATPIYTSRHAEIVAELFGRMRLAGFADKDFGAHNLLLDAEGRIYWTDLERAYRASVDDADATARSAGSLLASWWEASGGDTEAARVLWRAIQSAAPMPAGGWHATVAQVNQSMMKKCEQLMARNRLKAMPPEVDAG